MPSPCDPRHAPVGDVGGALLLVDSRLKAVHAGESEADPAERALTDQYVASLGPGGLDELVDGTCTLVYMFTQWLRQAHEDQGKDVIEYVVPTLVESMRMMPKSVRPEVIPTMVGLVVAAGIGLSPNLWRARYGEWAEDELTPLEATAFLLAEHINRVTEDRDFATRLIGAALSEAESAEGADGAEEV